MKADPPIPDELWRQIPPAAQAAILALIQRYEQRLTELEARLNQNSTNSSKPPSSDPPALKRAPPKTPSTKKAGGQQGHAKVQRALVDHPDAIHDCKPTACRHCQQPLRGDDPQPLRHQVWDVPTVRPIVTDYRRHRLTCPRWYAPGGSRFDRHFQLGQLPHTLSSGPPGVSNTKGAAHETHRACGRTGKAADSSG
jgi:transposase